MSSPVTIHRCPTCSSIKSTTDYVVEQLSHLGIVPNVRDGQQGEFRIDVGGKTAIEKTGDSLPSAEQIVKAMERDAGASSA